MSTPTPATPTPADVARQLTAALATATGQAVDDLKGVAELYAPQLAQAVVVLAAARVSGDAESIYYAQSDVEAIQDDVLLDAALAAVTAQAAGEHAVLDAVRKVVTLLVNAAVARLVG